MTDNFKRLRSTFLLFSTLLTFTYFPHTILNMRRQQRSPKHQEKKKKKKDEEEVYLLPIQKGSMLHLQNKITESPQLEGTHKSPAPVPLPTLNYMFM